MPKQTGSIDLSSQKQAHDDASKTATNYIRADSTGIRIANSNPDNATTYQHQTATDTEFIVGGVSRAIISGNGARFGKAYISGAQDNESHMELDYHSLQMIDKEGNPYLYVSDLRDRSGTANVVDTFYGDGATDHFYLTYNAISTPYTVEVSDNSGGTVSTNYNAIIFDNAPTDGAVITATYATTSQFVKAFTFGTRQSNSFIGGCSFSVGHNNIASGYFSHAEGFYADANGLYSHTEGCYTTANGSSSHAEGNYSIAIGSNSHAEGISTNANGNSSHAEGGYTSAIGVYSHAEGHSTQANGHYSHAEGYGTKTIGAYSHAQNRATIASGSSQTAIGRYNIQDDNDDYAFIIGNGSSTGNRSNALTVDWNGHILTRADPTTNKKIPSSSPSSNIIISSTVNQDCDGNQVGYSQIIVDTTYSLYRSFAVQRGSTVNALYLQVNSQGQRIITVSEAAPWRNAIFGVTNSIVPATLGGTGNTSLQATRSAMGLGNTTGALPVANGGTGQTGTTNSNITLASGTSGSTYNVRKWGNVVTLFLYNIKFTAAVANGGSHDIGTIPTGYRPANGCFAQVASGNLSGPAYIGVTSGGAVSFTNRSGAQLAADKLFSATITYVIG